MTPKMEAPSSTTRPSSTIRIWATERCRMKCWISAASMSVPPVVALDMNTKPVPMPVMMPPKRAESSGSFSAMRGRSGITQRAKDNTAVDTRVRTMNFHPLIR